MRYWVAILCTFSAIHLIGQKDCSLRLEGAVLDLATQESLSSAHIYITEIDTGSISNEEGRFVIEDICPGDYHLRVSHLGCSPVHLFLSVTKDTFMEIFLDHHDYVLHQIEVEGLAVNSEMTSVRSTISKEQILDSQGRPLGEVVAKLPGVSMLQTGAGIVKPVIHGLTGQRIAIIHNGMNLTGQRWASGHSPEVDMETAESITVVKGASALEYGGEGLGGAVVVDQGVMPSDPHLHGQLGYTFSSNGLGHHLSGRLQKRQGNWAWKSALAVGVLGTQHTPDYYLTNTGQKNLSFAFGLYKEHNSGSSQLEYSFLQNETGILRGSLIANTTDLEKAFLRDEPFYTEDEHSYDLGSPRQEVQHHALNYQTTRLLNAHASLHLAYGIQYNHREEFDVRRGGRSDIPALDLSLWSHQLKGYYLLEEDNWLWKTGAQHISSFNRNDGETGLLPLLPDYNGFQSGVYSTFKKSFEASLFEAGLRYDHRWNSVVQIESDVDRSISRFREHFHALTFSLGLSHEWNEHFNGSINIGATQRPPGIHELYSFGLHQGVASIEEGNLELKSEFGWKAISRMRWHSHDHFWIEASAYVQWIDDFIFLQPQDELRLTVRGAFPVFRYQQTDALLTGIDLNMVLPVTENWSWSHAFSYLYGHDRTSDQPLIFMPQNNWLTHLTWQPDPHWSVSASGQYFWEQTRFPEGQDFINPPPGFFVIGMKGKFETKWKKKPVKFALHVDNLTNQRYRHYLNRWRYFADELGVNVRAQIRMDF